MVLCNAQQRREEFPLLRIVIFVTHKGRCMTKNLMIILILMLSLNHCSSTDIINVGAAVFSGMEDKPNPIGAVKMLMKKKKDKNEK
jgi:hypothetical protein